MKTRDYNYKDVEMLLASKTIANNLSENLSDLSIARTTWTDKYAAGLELRIDDAIENYLGLDKKRTLREASSHLASIQNPAMRDLSFLKTQIVVDFDQASVEILKRLGFEKHLRDVQKGNQEALIQLLYAFRKGMSKDLKDQITAKGTNPALIERLIAYAEDLKEANVSQESLKESTKLLSEEAIEIFNDIYEEVMGICKIAAAFYQYEPLKKEQFTFSKAISNMSAAHKVTVEEV